MLAQRPMFYDEKPDYEIKARIGNELICKNWDIEAAHRMIHNNITEGVALMPEELVVYGGSGRAARNWRDFNVIVKSLEDLEEDETLLVQSGRAVYVAKTHEEAPRVIIANSNLIPADSTENYDKAYKNLFERLDRAGLMMYGQMTAGSWIYIGTQGILQGTYETLAAVAKNDFNQDSLAGKFVLTAGMGAMSGAQPLAGTLNEAAILVVEPRLERIQQKVKEGYCDEMVDDLDEALCIIDEATGLGLGVSVGLVGNAAETHLELVTRDILPDVVTDQTSAHDILRYIPIGDLEEMDQLRIDDTEKYEKLALKSIATHTKAMIRMQEKGAIVFDYGNNLRGQAERAGVNVRNENGSFVYPGFVLKYVRPLFCEGKGPFRWAALSGDKEDIYTIDEKLLKLFPNDGPLKRWIKKTQEKLDFDKIPGLPTRICWLGYGDRAKAGLAINNLVYEDEVKAPVVIGRDHLDCGSVASPNRETEGMRDGTDAVADWPLLNFALNSVNGASWTSVHNGGGVGIGNSMHAGMVIVADGTPERDIRLKRVLDGDPGSGIARHLDAGYETAQESARRFGVKIPRRKYRYW